MKTMSQLHVVLMPRSFRGWCQEKTLLQNNTAVDLDENRVRATCHSCQKKRSLLLSQLPPLLLQLLQLLQLLPPLRQNIISTATTASMYY